MEKLLSYLNSIFSMSPCLRGHLTNTLKSKAFARKDYLLKAGHVCRNIYFIEKGLCRCFYMKNNIEVCSWFMHEGDVIVSVESFFDQASSYESIQALEDTVVHYISFQDLEFMYRNFIEFNFMGRVLLQKYYKMSEQRLHSMRMQSAAERYQYLLQHYPEIVLRVPAGDIASYLGITKETLSRIKKS